MENQERQIIQSLFIRLSDVEKQAPPRDAEAEALIKERVGQQPAAPYFMAQTIVMQEYALQQAQQRIEDLEQQTQERRGGGVCSEVCSAMARAAVAKCNPRRQYHGHPVPRWAGNKVAAAGFWPALRRPRWA